MVLFTDRLAPSLVVIGLVLTLAGCGQAQMVVDQAGAVAKKAAETATKDAATAAVSTAATSALKSAGISLVSSPDCKSKFSLNAAAVTATGDVTCVGRTTESKAVRITFTGTLSTSACEGPLTIVVEDRAPIVVKTLKNCSIKQLVGGSSQGSQS